MTEQKRYQPITIQIPPAQIEYLNKKAREQETSRNAVLRDLIRQDMQSDNNQ